VGVNGQFADELKFFRSLMIAMDGYCVNGVVLLEMRTWIGDGRPEDVQG
jgi:hypothetical protein